LPAFPPETKKILPRGGKEKVRHPKNGFFTDTGVKKTDKKGKAKVRLCHHTKT